MFNSLVNLNNNDFWYSFTYNSITDEYSWKINQYSKKIPKQWILDYQTEKLNFDLIFDAFLEIYRHIENEFIITNFEQQNTVANSFYTNFKFRKYLENLSLEKQNKIVAKYIDKFRLLNIENSKFNNYFIENFKLFDNAESSKNFVELLFRVFTNFSPNNIAEKQFFSIVYLLQNLRKQVGVTEKEMFVGNKTTKINRLYLKNYNINYGSKFDYFVVSCAVFDRLYMQNYFIKNNKT